MLRSLKDYQTYSIHAKDGDIGSIYSFLFDDQTWIVRYFVLDIGKWLEDKRVLIPPVNFIDSNWQNKTINLNLKKNQIENSPEITEHKPVYLQKQQFRNEEYDYPVLLHSAGLLPNIYLMAETEKSKHDSESTRHEIAHPHLRSTREILGYAIHAVDGEVGRINDFIVEDHLTWNIHYIVVDTGHWLPGKKVVLHPYWIHNINWHKKQVEVDLKIEKIKNSPIFDPSEPVNREYETVLFDFYGKPKYWS
jgi:hypothetical protein